MSKLTKLLDRAKGLLDNFRPDTDATDAVKADRFDRRLFEEMREEAPALDRTIRELGRDVDYAEDIVRDTLLQFWQGNPELRKQGEMEEGHLAAHGVATDVSHSNELKDARRYTVHDRYSATMGAIGVSDKVKEWAKHRGDALKEAKEEAEEKRKAEQEAMEELKKAVDAAGQIDPDAPFLDEEFIGPLTDEQQAAVQAAADLQAIGHGADQAAHEAQQAADALAAAAAEAQQELAPSVSGAVKNTRDKLKDEAQTFNAWGVDPGELQNMPFEERAQLAARLKNSRIGDYLELVGRFKMMAAAQQVRKVEYGRDQVVGVEMTGDLSRVVMSEFAALGMGDDDLGELMELDFYRRWFEEQLIGRKFEGTEKVGKGAIVCAVDGSGSMTQRDQHGIPREAWSKAFAFALLDQARRQKRDFVGINFSSRNQVSVHRFPAGRGTIAQAVGFVEEFHNGGTDFEAPMDAAIKIIGSEFDQRGKAKADIVFITDDDCRVSTDWMRTYQERKKRLAFRTFGIAVGATRPGSALSSLSDNVRAVTEFADPSEVRDIFQIL